MRFLLLGTCLLSFLLPAMPARADQDGAPGVTDRDSPRRLRNLRIKEAVVRGDLSADEARQLLLQPQLPLPASVQPAAPVPRPAVTTAAAPAVQTAAPSASPPSPTRFWRDKRQNLAVEKRAGDPPAADRAPDARGVPDKSPDNRSQAADRFGPGGRSDAAGRKAAMSHEAGPAGGKSGPRDPQGPRDHAPHEHPGGRDHGGPGRDHGGPGGGKKR